MGPDVVVLAEPLVDDDLGLPGGGEPFGIQDFPAPIPPPAVGLPSQLP